MGLYVRFLQLNGEWEVIDGQQRLTTIFIILSYFNKRLTDEYKKQIFKLSYATRPGSEIYLKDIKKAESEKNIDYFFIYEALTTVINWFKDKQQIVNDFESTLLNKTNIIWYEVEDLPDTKPVDIFTRINIGKIPLTNAELIKALFLGKIKFGKGQDAKVNAKQLQIASEWDIIEFTLQDDSFWYFIYEGGLKYETRIDYIFDLMKNKPDDEEFYYTFHKFNLDYDKDKDIDKIWQSIKKYFLTFEEWYNDRELYHMIGYLISTGYSLTILKSKSENQTKTEFKSFLKSEIISTIDFDIEVLDYDKNSDKPKIKRLLLLFNIQTIISNEKANILFPFDNFKKENWDIEHIRSVTEKRIIGNSRKLWISDILEFFTGQKDREMQIKEVESLSKKIQPLLQKLLSLIDTTKIEDAEFDPIYNKIIEMFGEDTDPGNINSISNLALLDSYTNRSYKNAPFPIKRNTIIENDMTGTFVPICTKNVFLKFYSKRSDHLMYWQQNDAIDYMSSIKRTLSEYLQ